MTVRMLCQLMGGLRGKGGGGMYKIAILIPPEHLHPLRNRPRCGHFV